MGKNNAPAGRRGKAISIVVVNWDRWHLLENCLQSIFNEPSDDVEVVVVDNGSRDGSAPNTKRTFPRVAVIESGTNLGFAEAANRGIEAACGAWIFTLNNDATVEPGTLTLLRNRIAEVPSNVGMIQPQVLFSYDPDTINTTGLMVSSRGIVADRNFGEPRDRAENHTAVFCPSAGAALYRMEMLRQIRLPTGFFDRTFYMYCEDLDIGWRARLAGWEAEYHAEATCLHKFQATSKTLGQRFIASRCRLNRMRTFLKNGSTAFLRAVLGNTYEDIRALRTELPGSRVPSVITAAVHGLSQRRKVGAMAVRRRGEIERRWFTGD